MPYDLISPSAAVVVLSPELGAPLRDQGMTFRDFKKALSDMLGGRDDIDEDVIARWVNFGYQDLCSMLDLDELRGSVSISTAIDSAQYYLPYTVRVIDTVGLYDSSPVFWGRSKSRPLAKKDLAWYRAQKDGSGQPFAFFTQGRVLVLYYTPNTVISLSVDCMIRPQPMANELDCPIIPDEWNEGILKAARQSAYSELEEFDKMVLAQNDKVSFVRSKMNLRAANRVGMEASVSVPRNWRDIRRGR